MSDAAKQEPARTDLLGLAISGGGIRSATFALGILQGLAKRKILSKLSFLSTVSGGGYIGSWLSVWASRVATPNAPGINIVEEQLHPEWRHNNVTPSGEPGPLAWIRAYGNYLAPKPGLFSADTWLIMAIWSRNTAINLLVLIPFLLGLLTIPWLVAKFMLGLYLLDVPELLLTAALTLLTLASVVYILMPTRPRPWFGQDRGLIPAAIVSFSAIIFTAALWRSGDRLLAARPYHIIGAWGAVIALICIGSMLLPRFWAASKRGKFARLARMAIGAAFGYGGLVLAYHKGIEIIGDPLTSLDRLLFAAPIFAVANCGILVVLIGCASWRLSDLSRESWSRAGAWIGILFALGMFLCAVSYYGPLLISFAVKVSVVGIPAGILWTVISALGTYFAQSGSTSGKPSTRRPILDSLLPAAGVVFVVGFLFLLSALLFYTAIDNIPLPNELWANMLAEETSTTPWANIWANLRQSFSDDASMLIDSAIPFYGLGGFVIWMLLGRVFSINDFSMFSFYRNRLVRAYCGASNPNRTSGLDSFTDMNANDDVALYKLTPDVVGYTHLFCTAANVNLDRSGFAERKAVPFVFGPLDCWYTLPRSVEGDNTTAELYARTYPRDLDYEHEATVGTAIAISGAAASPNMGYHTSPILAAIMTLFNVRLGYWMFNTAETYSSLRELFRRKRADWRPRGPKWGTFYYLFELAAKASRHRKYLYLSDGGHFENLGLYELIRRKLPYIIVLDGECDPRLGFESLGGILRKARADFGAEIAIDTSSIAQGNAHATVGDIKYADQSIGKLLYFKLSITGDEPQDILTYRGQFPDFPHQSTGDQFFSESQFESYRRLGLHVADRVLTSLGDNFTLTGKNLPSELKLMFDALDQALTPIPSTIADNFTRQTESLKQLLAELQGTTLLAPLAKQLMDPTTNVYPTDPEKQACHFFCQRLLQLMEDVYFDLHLETNFKHPATAGWMRQFEHWSRSTLLTQTYDATCATYSPAFQHFFNLRLR